MPPRYTPETIAAQYERAATEAINRALAEYEPGPEADAMAESLRVAFLTGANLTAAFLVRTDGEVNPQTMERALAIVGKNHGLEILTAAQANALAGQ